MWLRIAGADCRHQLASWVMDTTTFAYLTDVFVFPAYRGTGLDKWLVANVLKRTFDTEITGHERAELGGGRYVEDVRIILMLHTSIGIALYERYAEFEVTPDGGYMVLQIEN